MSLVYLQRRFHINWEDTLFAPQSKEDTDIFNRFQLVGIGLFNWGGCVYHVVCRGNGLKKMNKKKRNQMVKCL